MRMTLGRRGEYAIRAVLDLARHRTVGRRKAREIASAMAIPTRYLPHVMAPLVRCGLVSSAAGREGGYSLVEAPSAVSLLEVIEAAEGRPLEPAYCAFRGGRCDPRNPCPLHHAWTRANRVFIDQLREITFDDLVTLDDAGNRRRIGTSARPRSTPPQP